MGNIGAWCRIIGIVTVLAFVLKYCARATHIAGWANIYVKLFIWSDIYHIIIFMYLLFILSKILFSFTLFLSVGKRREDLCVPGQWPHWQAASQWT